MPTSAGLYYFAAKMAPPKYAALASWITGWANITGQVTLVCSIDFTCAQMITTAIAVNTEGVVVMSAVGTTVAAIIALLVCSGDHKASTKDAFTLFENNSGWTNNGWAFLLAFTAPMWTLTGYDSAAHVSEESAGASRAAPLAILIGVAGTAGLGWILLIAASFATTSVSDLLTTTLPLPMGQLFLNTLGKKGMLTLWSFIIVVQYVTGAAQGVDASRVIFAFARDNALPGSRWWKQINSRTQTPIHAVWFVMVGAAICGLLGFSNAALSSLAGAAVIGLYVSYALPILLRITSGRDKLVPGPFSLGKWYLPIGAVAVAWVMFIIVLLLFPSFQTVTPQDMNYAVVIIMAVFLFAAVSWMVSARKWFIGPVRTTEEAGSPSCNSKVM
ncbi:hypothetical protein HWV62_2615 [Athelia sp. TMB]|nr:hypothetical protein HWV62_2615 [Athelia sp. TMB]